MTALSQPASQRDIALGTALDLAAAGYHLIPVTLRRKPDGKKLPQFHAGKNHVGNATRDPERIRGWWRQHPDCSFAIVCGPSGVEAVDLDVKPGFEDGRVWWNNQGLSNSSGGGLVVQTASGGVHLIWQRANGRKLTNNAKKIHPNVDTRSDGGLLFAPGSYVVGEPGGYMLLTTLLPPEHLAPTPAAVLDLVSAIPENVTQLGVETPEGQLGSFTVPAGTPRYTPEEANKRIAAAVSRVVQAREGFGFNATLNDAAYEIGHWVDVIAGLDEMVARSILEQAVTVVFPGGPDGDDVVTIGSGLGSGMAKPYALFEPAAAAIMNQVGQGEQKIGPGFARLRRGAISQRDPIEPPKVYDPGSGPLLYSTGIHWLFGESGSGKTWVALDAIARVLKSGGTALMIDYEDTLNAVLDRLSALGVDDDQVAQFAYVDGHDVGTAELLANLAVGEEFDISVLDGVTTSITEFGAASNDGDDVTRWANAIPRAMTGAVVCVDHVTKNTDTRGGYAIGSQAKKAVVTGASYEAVCDTPLRKGGTGRIRLVLRKDKRGGIGVAVGDTAARLEFASSPDGSVMRTGSISAQQAEQAPVEAYDPRVMLVATVLESAHNRGDLNLEDGVRKLTDWIRGHGHLMEGGTARKDDVGEAIRYARGWAGLPHIADKYRIRPISPICPSGDTPLVDQGVPQDQMGVPQDHGDSGDTRRENQA